MPQDCHNTAAQGCAIVLSPTPAGVTVHPTVKTFVVSVVVASSFALLFIGPAPVKRTASLCVQIVWLYFVTGARG